MIVELVIAIIRSIRLTRAYSRSCFLRHSTCSRNKFPQCSSTNLYHQQLLPPPTTPYHTMPQTTNQLTLYTTSINIIIPSRLTWLRKYSLHAHLWFAWYSVWCTRLGCWSCLSQGLLLYMQAVGYNLLTLTWLAKTRSSHFHLYCSQLCLSRRSRTILMHKNINQMWKK